MPFGKNPLTGRPGPSPRPARDGDKKQARHRVNCEVNSGAIPSPNDLPCFDCGHLFSTDGKRARIRPLPWLFPGASPVGSTRLRPLSPRQRQSRKEENSLRSRSRIHRRQHHASQKRAARVPRMQAPSRQKQTEAGRILESRQRPEKEETWLRTRT